MKFKDFKEAVKSKLRDKTNMPDWYFRRLEICSQCEFNSGNRENISIKDKIRISHNFGKDSCLKCTCGIKDAASSESKACPENKWFPIDMNYSDDYNIYSLDSKKLYFIKETKYYVLDFGNVKKDTKAIGKIFLETIKPLSNLSLKSSCGCTAPKETKKENGYEIEVEYKNTNRLGGFNQSVKVGFVNDKNIPQVILIKIKGTIIN